MPAAGCTQKIKHTPEVEVLKWVGALTVIFNFTDSSAVNTSSPPHLRGKGFPELPLHSFPATLSAFGVVLVSKVRFPYPDLAFILEDIKKKQPTNQPTEDRCI